jgi:hypothetical protein
MKTAVEFLASVLSQTGPITEYDFNSLVEQAKQMEKEQIENSFYHGVELTKIRVESIIDEADFEDYYNETFTNSTEIPTSSKQEQ